MIVFGLHMVGIDGTEIPRCYSMSRRSTCSTKWSASLKWHQKFGLRSMALMTYHTAHTQWGQIWCDQQDFPRQHNILGARTLCCLGKFHWPHHRCFLYIYLNYIPYMAYTARIKFSMPFQWCTSFSATSTTWECTVASGHFWPIKWLLYPGQTLAYHSWAIWLEPDFQCNSNGVLQFAWKVLCGKVFPYLPTILPFLQAIYWTNAAIANIIQMAKVRFSGSSELYYSQYYGSTGIWCTISSLTI